MLDEGVLGVVDACTSSCAHAMLVGGLRLLLGFAWWYCECGLKGLDVVELLLTEFLFAELLLGAAAIVPVEELAHFQLGLRLELRWEDSWRLASGMGRVHWGVLFGGR